MESCGENYNEEVERAISERARSSLCETSSSSFGRQRLKNVLQSLTIVERIIWDRNF